MRRHVVAGLMAAVMVCGVGIALDAQQQKQRASPHETAAATVHGAKISVTYGRPYVKGRTIFGDLVPYGKIWRTGADEATILETDTTLAFGSVTVAPGKYSLYTIPGEKEWTLVINKQVGQWGTRYDEAQDLGRVPMTVGPEDFKEQFEIDIEEEDGNRGALEFQWDKTEARAVFTVKK